MYGVALPLSIPHRFRGPASSGNGGWTAGALAGYLAPGPVRVTLVKPPPLDTPLEVSTDSGVATASLDGQVIAVAKPATADLTPVTGVTAQEARAAEASYAGLGFHPFPTCFSCGTDRGPGDGLRIFPGRVSADPNQADSHDAGDGGDGGEGVRIAATWTPDPSLGSDTASLAVTWAALDCIGGWAGDLAQRLMVLGSISAHVLDLPRIGEEHVLVGSARGSEGRKTFTASSLYAADGSLLGYAEHTWVAVDPADFA